VLVAKSPSDDVSSAITELRNLEAEVMDLERIHAELLEAGGESDYLGENVALSEALPIFESRQKSAEALRNQLRLRLDELKLRMKLFRIGADEAEPAQVDDIPNLSLAISLVEKRLKSIISEKLLALSRGAKKLWDELETGRAEGEVVELLLSGLLIAATAPGDVDEQR
jgi:DNA repair ATPase RecN